MAPGPTPTPAVIAQNLLNHLHDKLDATDDVDRLLQLAQLAALVEIADRLTGIENSLDTGVKIYDIGQ
jgi:hypothetical protein